MTLSIPDLPGAASAEPKQKPTPPSSVFFDLSGLPVDQLLELRARIDQALPARALKDLDLEQELVVQLLSTQELQRKALSEDTPANQLAQVSNTVQAALQTLVKLQNDVYKSERLKKIEGALLQAIENLPMKEKDAFLTAYEALTEGL